MISEMPLGEFLPDLPSYQNPGLVKCENVIALPLSYGPIRGLVESGIEYTGDVRGVQRFDQPDGFPLLAFGTTTDLYIVLGSGVFASGLSLSLGDGEFWAFEQFGLSLYASCKGVGTFRLADILSDTSFIAATGSPPSAKHIGAFGDFLFAGNLLDIDSNEAPYRVRWSSFNDPSGDWSADIGRQSGAVDMNARYGEVTGLGAGVVDLIFQKTAISRIEYVGGASIFSKREIDIERGCVAPRSLVRIGGSYYFLAQDGFCRTDGGGVEVVSSSKVYQWFIDAASNGYEADVVGSVDWRNKTIYWTFKGEGFASYNRHLLYNWELNKWTTAAFEVDMLVASTETGATLDETDTGVTDDDDLDIDGPSFDDPRYSPQGRSLVAMHDGKIKYMTGSALEAQIELGDFQISPGQRSFVTSIRAISESADNAGSYAIAGRDVIGTAKTYTAEETAGPLGFAPVISDALFHSVRVKMPTGAAWTKLSALQIDSKPSGIA